MRQEILISIVFAQVLIIVVIIIYKNGGINMGFLKRGRPRKEEVTEVVEEAPSLKSKTIQSSKETEDMNIDAAKQRKKGDFEYFQDLYANSYTPDEFALEGSFESEICTLVYGMLQELKNQNYMLQNIMLALQK